MKREGGRGNGIRNEESEISNRKSLIAHQPPKEVFKASALKYDGGLTCSLGVTDIKRSIAWYQETLGFQLLYHVEEMGWCELATETPGVRVGLSQVEKVPKGGGSTLTFGVLDIEHARKSLEAKKVKFDGPTRTYEGMVRLATFFDPDGNAMMFFEDLQKK